MLRNTYLCIPLPTSHRHDRPNAAAFRQRPRLRRNNRACFQTASPDTICESRNRLRFEIWRARRLRATWRRYVMNDKKLPDGGVLYDEIDDDDDDAAAPDTAADAVTASI